MMQNFTLLPNEVKTQETLNDFLNSDGLLPGVCHLWWSFRRRISMRFATISGLRVYFAILKASSQG